MKHKTIFDRDFRYVPSNQTDIRRTFARVRRELEAQKRVVPFQRKVKA